jgi:putative ABC transport system permease protein
MFKNILNFAIRSLWKNRVISIFNIVGLTLAVSALLFIIFYLRFELSYDRFHTDYQRIYSVYFDELGEGVRDRYIQAPMGLGSSLLEDFPEVEAMVRTNSAPKSIVTNYSDNKEYVDNLIWADPSFFNLFSVELLPGSDPKILDSPNQIGISRKCAKKYFSDENPIGQTLIVNGQKYEVKAVFRNYPENSHLTFDLIGSLSTITKNRDQHEWDGYMFSTYIKLKKGVDAKVFEKRLHFLITDRLAPYAEKHYQLNIEGWFKRGNSMELKLMPLSKIHLFASDISGFDGQNDIINIILLVLASVLILFIACFNSINFNISLFRKNVKTVGIKKICGSTKRTISFQAFIEALFIFIISSVFAIIIIYSLRSTINGLLKHTIIAPPIFESAFYVLLGSGCLIAIICGYLPLIRNIQKSPDILLKNNVRVGKKELSANQMLFGLQLMIAIVMMNFFFIINNQVNLITTHDLGFNQNDIMIIHGTNRNRDKAVVLAGELRKLPGVKAVSVTNAYPGDNLPTKDLQLKNSPEGFSYSPQYFCCDQELAEVLNFRLVEGDFFSENLPENSILLNETALKTYKITDNPIGQIFTRTSGETYTVIGVVRDFNFKSLHRPVEPLCIYTGVDRSNSLGASKILISLKNKDESTIGLIKQKWNSVYNNAYFEYSFLEDEINALYTKEMLLRKAIPISAVLAFLISAIGLIGISFIKMEEKTKEIGIRKVNGARIYEVLIMLNRDFVKWVAIAFVIATPFAYYAMDKWLENFAYKTELSWWIFALAGLLALGIALLTVSWQSWRAATRNPVEALRYE